MQTLPSVRQWPTRPLWPKAGLTRIGKTSSRERGGTSTVTMMPSRVGTKQESTRFDCTLSAPARPALSLSDGGGSGQRLPCGPWQAISVDGILPRVIFWSRRTCCGPTMCWATAARGFSGRTTRYFLTTSAGIAPSTPHLHYVSSASLQLQNVPTVDLCSCE